MELETFFSIAILAILAPVFLGALFVLYCADPPLPGPSLREYLPGGIVFQLFLNPHSFASVLHQLMRKYGDKYHLWLGPVRHVVTAVPKDVAQIISTAECFSRPPQVKEIFSVLAPGGLFESVGAIHVAQRKNLRKRFNHSMLKSFEQRTNKAVEELCSRVNGHVAGKDPFVLSDYIGLTVLRVVTEVALGSRMEAEERIKFNRVLDDLADVMFKEFLGYPIHQALAPFGTRNKFLSISKSLHKTFRGLIQKRLSEYADGKASKAPDMLDTYLETCQGNVDQAISLSFEAAIAANHTTNQMITWAMYELCCNPGVREKLEEELDRTFGNKPLSEFLTLEELRDLQYLHQVWKEVLRRRPIIPSVMRRATREVVLNGSGLRIPKGCLVIALFSAGHVDPTVWRSPLEFRPERWSDERGSEGQRAPPGTYLPFGAGGYSCVGRFLADYEGPLILAELCRRFSFQLGCKPEEVENRSLFVDSAKWVVGNEERGVPFLVSRKM